MPKRARGSSPDVDDGSEKSLKRSEHVWFEDGNIVLITQNTMFKVYRGLLASASPVFRDMLSIRQPELAEEIEGCPVVRLDDAVEDMSHFLTAIVDGVQVLGSSSHTDSSWPVTRALLRLGDKYGADTLFNEGKARLEKTLPNSIEAWDALYEGETGRNSKCSYFIGMANAAREFNMKGLHLRALYRCAQLETKILVGGCPGADGTYEHLSTVDLTACIDGRHRLHEAVIKLRSDEWAYWDGFAVEGECTCDDADVHDLRRYLNDMKWDSMDFDPLEDKFWAKNMLKENFDFCQCCTTAGLHLYEYYRRRILGSLENFFDIEQSN
ncbi:hypothetical protein BXZ70DRAFT_941597 [Cristinia sonorae]|uniref:BTB domain-containing protein n=1 Tax=Cristinia sonorae TaxID=1940300 RepID=A0A8K0UPE1_9AGAR|nr:hypothetical protein BXZ70DRAFT_941597 [Cristinia sonorae]